MGWITVLVLVAVAAVVLPLDTWLARAVGQKLLFSYAFSHCVIPWILKGFDGTRVVLYHQSSRMLIQVVKRLSARRSDAKVSLTVTKTHLSGDKRYEPSRGWRLPLKRLPYPYVVVPRWRLPSPYRDGEEVARIDCGASLARAKEVLRDLVSGDAQIATDPTFYVWLENGAARAVIGAFEDEG